MTIYFCTYQNEDNKDSDVNMEICEFVITSNSMEIINQFEINGKYKSDKVMELACDDTSAILSLGIKYAGALQYDDKNLKLIYQDGNEVVSDIKTVDVENESVTIEFGKLIDIQGLKSVVLKGTEYWVTDYENGD